MIVMLGLPTRYRRLQNGIIEIVHDYFTSGYLFHHDPTGVDSTILDTWSPYFVDETAYLRRNGENIVLLQDGYTCHIQNSMLVRCKNAGIAALGRVCYPFFQVQSAEGFLEGPL